MENINNILSDITVLNKNLADGRNCEKQIDNICSHENLQLIHLKQLPEEAWNMELLSLNYNINVDWLKNYPDKNWDFKLITQAIYRMNENSFSKKDKHFFTNLKTSIRKVWFSKFPDANWDYNKIYEHNDFTLEELHLIPILKHDYKIISTNSNITLKWLTSYPDGDWDFYTLSRHSSFDLKWLNHFPDKPWDFKFLSFHSNISLEWIDALPDADWCFTVNEEIEHTNFNECNFNNYNQLNFYRENYNIDWTRKYPNLSWNFSRISANYTMCLSVLEEFPEADWDFTRLSLNNNVTLPILQKYADKNWHFYSLSIHPNLNLDWLKEFPNKPWDFKKLATQDNFGYDWIKEFPDKNWDIESILRMKYGRQLSLSLCYYQLHNPEKDIFKYIYASNERNASMNNYIWDKIKLPVVSIAIHLIKPEYVEEEDYFDKRKRFKSYIPEEFKHLPHLNKSEKESVLRFIEIIMEKNYRILNFTPEMFSYPDMDLELVDLSGNTYYLSNWLESDNLMESIYKEFPELGKIDIMLNDERHDACIMGSKTNNRHLIEKIIYNKQGPVVMIVYPDEDAIEESEEEITISEDFW